MYGSYHMMILGHWLFMAAVVAIVVTVLFGALALVLTRNDSQKSPISTDKP